MSMAMSVEKVADFLSVDYRTLLERIERAKYFLAREMNQIKASGGELYRLDELNYYMEVLYEAERIGVRNLNEMERIRVGRVLEQIEQRMASSMN